MRLSPSRYRVWLAPLSEQSPNSSPERSSNKHDSCKANGSMQARNRAIWHHHLQHHHNLQSARTRMEKGPTLIRPSSGVARYVRIIFERPGSGTGSQERAAAWECSNYGMRSKQAAWRGSLAEQGRGCSSDMRAARGEWETDSASFDVFVATYDTLRMETSTRRHLPALGK